MELVNGDGTSIAYADMNSDPADEVVTYTLTYDSDMDQTVYLRVYGGFDTEVVTPYDLSVSGFTPPTDGMNDSGTTDATPSISVDQAETNVALSGETTLTYTVGNPLDEPTNILLEFPAFPTDLSLQSAEDDISETLFGSSPPGVITSQVPAGSSATVEVTVGTADSATAGENTVIAEATVSTSDSEFTNETTTTLTITEQDPLVVRFGGDDNEIGNLDVLQAVNAANSGRMIGGEPVSNLDILRVVNQANQ
jgi:hypothetical protein